MPSCSAPSGCRTAHLYRQFRSRTFESRMIISLGLLIALASGFSCPGWQAARIQISRTQMIAIIAGGAPGLVAMLSVGWYGAAGRWAELASAKGKDESMVERLLVSQVCFHMMSDSGIWGFGPGISWLVFPTTPLI